MEHPSYSVVYIEEDGEYVATSPQYPGLSYLDPIPYVALQQLMSVIAEAIDILKEA